MRGRTRVVYRGGVPGVMVVVAVMGNGCGYRVLVTVYCTWEELGRYGSYLSWYQCTGTAGPLSGP